MTSKRAYKQKLRVHDIVKSSTVNGSGLRYTIFLQGCEHRCDGCHSPHTWKKTGGTDMLITDIFNNIVSYDQFNDGVTISGGEPLLQYKNVILLCKLLKTVGANIWLYTGYTMEKINTIFPEILKYVDVIIDGKYEKDNPTTKEFRGSDNQIMWGNIDGQWRKVN